MLRVENPNFFPLSVVQERRVDGLGTARTIFKLLIKRIPACLLFAGGPHHAACAQGDEASLSGCGYFVLWDARRQLPCIARHGLNLCQIRGPEGVEGYKLGYYALQLRDTRERNVHYPFEGPAEGAKLEQELESVDIARCFIDLGDFNS